MAVGLVAAGCSSDEADAPTTSAAAAVTTVDPAPTTAAAGGEASTIAPSTEAATAAPTAAPTAATTTTTSTTVAATTSTAPPTTIAPTTTFPLLTQGGIVIVANASGIDGAAAALTTKLGDLGFQTVKATNSTAYESKLGTSKVYFSGEGYPTAYSLAQLLGGLQVAAMPTPPPIQNAVDGLRGANVIVMLGGDLAGKEPPGAPEETTTTGPPIT